MNVFQKIQESKFSQFYLENCDKQLNNLKINIENIHEEYTKLFTYIQSEIMDSEVITSFNKKINSYTKWIDEIKQNKDNKKDFKLKEYFNNNIVNAFNDFIDIYQNEHLKKINKLIEDMKNIYEDIILSFDPPKINNSCDELINIQISEENNWEYLAKEKNDYSNFYEKSNSFINNSYSTFGSKSDCICLLECNFCKNKNSNYYCKHCNCYYCEECCYKINYFGLENDHLLIKMDEKQIEKQKEKMIFLQSFVNVMKKFIKKCNYIIKNENQDYINPNTYKKFQYPIIQNEDPINEIQFLLDTNETYELIKNEIDIDKRINENELNNILINSLKNMFGEKKLLYYSDPNAIMKIDEDFISNE